MLFRFKFEVEKIWWKQKPTRKRTTASALSVVKEKGIEQLSDAGAIEALCDQVIAANPKPATDFKAGNAASLNFLKGQVMKLSKGQANPALAGEILERKLKG